eukprot:gnl/Hemi2/26441_TR8877_c0_g4_i1.p1 gnl/Hemi2/26441_TR8877_c0_g4~~gnl/Hemi2/26441_TR8877_c0_g4_i1.p1  ORF type:complete len:121 (+),score=22.34 gnl/Hemi2/26441_TR8877_c0_g4_i1:88-450(+)
MSFAKLPANKPSQRNTTNPTNQHNPNSKKSGSGSSSLQVDAPFPVLSLEELRSNLEDCGLGYSSEQLAKASSEDVTCIFRTISKFLVGAAEDGPDARDWHQELQHQGPRQARPGPVSSPA